MRRLTKKEVLKIRRAAEIQHKYSQHFNPNADIIRRGWSCNAINYVITGNIRQYTQLTKRYQNYYEQEDSIWPDLSHPINSTNSKEENIQRSLLLLLFAETRGVLK